jgi:hypothetical protein
MNSHWSRFAILGSVSFVALSGCGGSGSGFGGGNSVAAVVSAKISVTLPTGYKPTGGLTVSGGLFGTAPLTGNTSASIKAWNTGSELVAVLDSTGNPVLLGWIGDGNTTINARTTADALTYFAIEGFGAPNENQAALLTAISQQSGGDAIATDISTDVSGGKNLGTQGATYASDLKAYALTLVGGSAPNVVRALTPVQSKSNPVERPATVSSISPDPTTPAGTQSGITVNAGTTVDTLSVSNQFRRRALLFIDRDNTFDGSTPPVNTPAPIAVSETEITPATGGVNGTTISGNLTGTQGSTSSAALPLLPVPSPQFGATYNVIAIGPGQADAAPGTLSTSEITDAQKFLRRTFFTDFFLPVMNRICISNTLTQIQGNSSTATTIANAMDSTADAQSAGVDAFVMTNFANAQPQMFAGDFLGANSSVLATLNSNSTTLNAVATYYSTFLQSIGNGFTPSNTNVTTVLGWMSTALKNVDVSSLPTALPQYTAITESQVYSTWTITQSTGATVSLAPANSSITTVVGNDTVNLTATVNFGAAGQPKGSTVLYSWTTPGAHGDLVFPDSTGTTSELNSTFNTSEYFANLVNQNNNGSDVVTVAATLKNADGTTKSLGSSTATISVNTSNTGGGTTLPVYSLRSASGSLITITGGTMFIRDLTTGVIFFQDINKTSNPIFTESFYDYFSGGINWLYFTNEPTPVHDSNYAQGNSGDTVQITFDCPSYAGATSIGIDQDAHLFSPAGKDMGVAITKFTSVVGGTDGISEDDTWYVQRNIVLP